MIKRFIKNHTVSFVIIALCVCWAIVIVVLDRLHIALGIRASQVAGLIPISIYSIITVGFLSKLIILIVKDIQKKKGAKHE